MRIVFYGEATASLALYLDGLAPDLAAQCTLMPPRRMAADFPLLARAGMVVFVRGFEQVWRSGLLAALDRAGVPCAWFTDDDLTALRHEQPGFGFYSSHRVQAFAERMTALIGTTPGLCARLAAFHANVLHWPCTLNEAALDGISPSGQERPTVVAFTGGAFRVQGLRDYVVPALNVIQRHELCVANGPAAAIPGTHAIPFQPVFARFLLAWRDVGPHILVHPPGKTRNLAYKSPGILLCALYLGAAPVVASEPAFKGIGADQGLTRADSVAAWRDAFTALAAAPARERALARLLVHARKAWPPDGPRATISALLALAAPGGDAAKARYDAALAMRWAPLAGFMWRERVRRFASHNQ